MNKIEELIAMKWGVHGKTLVCTGEHGEGQIMADTEAGFMLDDQEAAEVAKHIVCVHNNMANETLNPVLVKIAEETLRWEEQGRIEDSPLGGNCVKAAFYKGTSAGLRMAQAIILEQWIEARK